MSRLLSLFFGRLTSCLPSRTSMLYGASYNSQRITFRRRQLVIRVLFAANVVEAICIVVVPCEHNLANELLGALSGEVTHASVVHLVHRIQNDVAAHDLVTGVCLQHDRVLTRASIGGGRGADASPHFSEWAGQHRNCPPTFQFRKMAGHVA